MPILVNMAEDTESKTDDGATAAAAGKESTTTTTQSDDPTGSEPSTDTSKTTTEPASPAADDKSETPASPTVDRKDKTNGSKEEENKPKEETSPSIPSDTPGATPPVVSSSKRSRPPYKYDPEKITLRFLFANRDGLTVTVECAPADTVGEVKGALLSVWPEGKLFILCWSNFALCFSVLLLLVENGVLRFFLSRLLYYRLAELFRW